jgi:hypothetical protein
MLLPQCWDWELDAKKLGHYTGSSDYIVHWLVIGCLCPLPLSNPVPFLA